MSVDEPTRLIVLRHGQTAWNAEQRIQGHLDMPLNAVGRWQAQRLALALQGEPVAAVYASDLQRAADTAEPLASAAGLPVQRDAGLRERSFGVFEGMTFSDIEQHWPEQARRWRERDPDFGPEGGERLCDFFERSVAQVERLARRHCGQTVVLVSHGGLLDSLYRAALGVPLQAPRSWPVANAVVNRLLWTPQGLSLLLWHDARHLEGAPDDQPPPVDTP